MILGCNSGAEYLDSPSLGRVYSVSRVFTVAQEVQSTALQGEASGPCLPLTALFKSCFSDHLI